MFVLTLGYAANKIADKLSVYPQYSILRIDLDLVESKTNKQIQKQKSMEDYEKFFPELEFRKFFKQIKLNEEILFLCVGSSDLTGCCLRLFELLKERSKKISILYVRPDLVFLNEKTLKQEKLIFGIFQEYVRSGVVEKIIIFENSLIEKTLGSIPISKFYDKINETISSTYHMINVFNHIKPLFEIRSNGESNIANIATYGLFDLQSSEEKMFFPLKYITNKVFYFAFSKKEIEEDGSLIPKIKEQMKSRIEENMKIGFKIFQTDYDHNMAFCEGQTHIIQDF